MIKHYIQRMFLRLTMILGLGFFLIFFSLQPECSLTNKCQFQEQGGVVFSWLGTFLHADIAQSDTTLHNDLSSSIEFFLTSTWLTVLALLLVLLAQVYKKDESSILNYKVLLSLPIVFWAALLNGLDMAIDIPFLALQVLSYALIMILSMGQWFDYLLSRSFSLQKIMYMFPGSLSVNMGALFLFESLLLKDGLGATTVALYSEKAFANIILLLLSVLILFVIVQDTTECVAELQKN